MARSHDPDRYTPEDIEGLLNGWAWNEDTGRAERCRTWMEVRSGIEHRGRVESERFPEVIDLERALSKLAWIGAHEEDRPENQKGGVSEAFAAQARSAAALIACRMMLGYDTFDMRSAFGRSYRFDAERIVRKGAAWMAAYLSGCSLGECETAFREAK